MHALCSLLRELVGEVGEREAVLVECHPEEDHDGVDQNESGDALACLLGSELLGGGSSCGSFLLLVAFHVAEGAAEGIVDGNGENQRHASHSEGEVVGVCAAEAQIFLCPFHDFHSSGGGKEGADIDSHIENREARIATRGVLGLVIEVADHHLQVALEEAGAKADQQQGGKHSGQCHTAATKRHGQQQVAEEHDEDADGDHAAKAELVGHDTAHEGEEINEAEEGAVDDAGNGFRETKVLAQEESEDGYHRVVAEAFAGVGECEGIKPFRLIFEHELIYFMIFDFSTFRDFDIGISRFRDFDISRGETAIFIVFRAQR